MTDMATPTGTPADERMRRVSPLARIIARPELAAFLGSVGVLLFFALVASDTGFLTIRGTARFMESASHLGILGVTVALLMIAGEFDLSIGSMIGASGMVLAVSIAEFGLPVFAAFLLSLCFAAAVGAINGLLVIKTGLPSFIVTLASLFVLRGATIGTSRLITGRTQVGGLAEAASDSFTAKMLTTNVGPFPASILWWLALTALGTWVLTRTRFGNWIFATGGSSVAARRVGVPVDRVRVLLFVATAMTAALLASIQVLDVGSADALRGSLKELEVIAVAVIGGTLLTGGYGSVVGAALGSLTLAITQVGIFFSHIDSDWYQAVVGALIIGAVLLNQSVRNRVVRTDQ